MKKLLILLLLAVGLVSQGQTLQRVKFDLQYFYPNVQNPNPFKNLSYMLDDDVTTVYQFWSPPVNPVLYTFDMPYYSSLVVKQLHVLWNTGNVSTYKLYAIKRSDKSRVLIYDHPGGDYNPSDVTVDIPASLQVDASGLVVSSQGGGDFPDYIKIFGTYTDAPLPSNPITNYPIRNMLRINSHNYDYDSAWWYKPGQYEAKLKAYTESGLQGGRVYDDARMGTDDQGYYGFDPTVDGGFQTDRMYSDLKKANPNWIRQLCWQGPNKPNRQTYWAVGDSSSNLNLPYGANRAAPSSWAGEGRDGYALAARYGTNPNAGDYIVHPQVYWYEKPNVMLKGTGLADWLEPWNEDNAWWDAAHCLNTQEMLASMSAFYDGHKGTIPGAGVKNADPNMPVSCGGLASADPWFLHEGLDWVVQNRGYRADGTPNWPFDFYQFHAYPSAGDQWSGTPGGLPGEKTLIPWGKIIVDASNRYAGGMPAGIGELGWDINPNSDINAPTHDGYTAEVVRAQAGVRTVLLASKIGLYFLEWYRLFQDDNNADTEQWTIIFRSMSLLKQLDDGRIVRRTITDWFKQLGPWLDHRYASSLVDNDSMQVHKFIADGKPDMYPAWSVENTSQNDPVTGKTAWKERRIKYKFPFQKGTLYTFSMDSSGVMTSTPYNGDSITLTSSPVILVPDLAFNPLPIKLLSFTADRVNNTAVLNWKAEDVVRYDIERSTDGVTFNSLASTSGNTYTDLMPLPGKDYYRLKMFDDKGKFEYSPVKAVQFPQVGHGKFKVSVYNEIGQQIMYRENVDNIQQFKLTLPKGKALLLRYTSDDVNFFSDKYLGW